VNKPLLSSALKRSEAMQADRRVVMVTSAETEASLTEVVTNLATVSAETGQRVALLSTAGLSSPPGDEFPYSAPMWWRDWPTPGNGARLPAEEDQARLLNGPVGPLDVEQLLGETGVPGVSRLDLRHFVGHPAQVVIRVPEVVVALLEVVDLVFLEVPSYLSVHHGEGLTPLADVVLVVAEREVSTTKDLRRLSAALKRLEAPVVGLALTDGGVEMYDWGRVDEEFEEAVESSSAAIDPTEQIPISRSTGVPATPLDEVGVVEHSQREA
jgi:Mrp family chromosome partitioning ATPase